MATLSLRNFVQTVQDAAAVAQSSCVTTLNFAVGSIERALVEANASIALWLQYVALQVLAATRLATSTGTDVDSFVADYSLDRLPAIAAVGIVTLSRFSSLNSAIVPVGTQLKTSDGTQVFTVTADANNTLYSAVWAAYVIAAGTASAQVPVAAVETGIAGNVLPGSIALLASAVVGVDTVTNEAAFTSGRDAETDAALRQRFQLYIASLSKATLLAVGSAVESVQQGLSYVIQENTPAIGQFIVTVDDGTGAPSTALQNAVYLAVDAVRPVGSIFSVMPPSLTPVAIVVNLTIPSTIVRAPIDAAVGTAISAFVASLGVGQPLLYGRLFQVVYDASPMVTGATVLLNGAAADVAPGVAGVVRIQSLSVA